MNFYFLFSFPTNSNPGGGGGGGGRWGYYTCIFIFLWDKRGPRSTYGSEKRSENVSTIAEEGIKFWFTTR